MNLATLNTNIDPESSSGLNPKQLTEKGFCCMVYGMAARKVLRHPCMVENKTTNNKRITIRAL